MIFSRRSFFRRATAIVAAVALAPEIAFSQKIEAIVPAPPTWVPVLKPQHFDIFTDRETADLLAAAMQKYYTEHYGR